MTAQDNFLSVVNSITYLTLNDHIRLLEAYSASADMQRNETVSFGDQLVAARQKVEAGDFSFEAVGGMVREMNKVFYPEIKPAA